uniref:Uncharacterized protein n=1 Tax=Gorilla gorilla gorilla TaxID=9595 RepID=G3SJ45_GORGO
MKSSEELQCLKQMEEELLFLKAGQGSQRAGLTPRLPQALQGNFGAPALCGIWFTEHLHPAVGMPPNYNSSMLSLSPERTILSGGWSGKQTQQPVPPLRTLLLRSPFSLHKSSQPGRPKASQRIHPLFHSLPRSQLHSVLRGLPLLFIQTRPSPPAQYGVQMPLRYICFGPNVFWGSKKPQKE